MYVPLRFYFVDVSFLRRLVRECTYVVYIRRGILDIGSRLAVKVHTNSIYREGSALYCSVMSIFVSHMI